MNVYGTNNSISKKTQDNTPNQQRRVTTKTDSKNHATNFKSPTTKGEE